MIGVGRRGVLLSSATALSPLQPLSAPGGDDRQRFLDSYLRASRTYSISADSTARAAPLARRTTDTGIVQALSSKEAVFLGEHHPEFRDHLLQAALLQRMVATCDQRSLAVGLEAVQQKFQPVLDDYVARRIDEDELFIATEWQRRWYWPFDGYAPVLRMCRQHGLALVALDADSEDKGKVEVGGLAALDDAKLRQYIPDLAGFERFGHTSAFEQYVAYTLTPPFNMQKRLGQKMTASTSVQRSMTFENFVARQSFRDESMASATAAWLQRNPGGLLFGLVGTNHAKFSLGVQARTARYLPGGLNTVASVLLNPTPFNSFDGPSSLRACDRTAVPNEACLLNDIEVQNYVLQLRYAAAAAAWRWGTRDSEGRARIDEAVSTRQAREGSSVLPLADYVMFSPAYEPMGSRS